MRAGLGFILVLFAGSLVACGGGGRDSWISLVGDLSSSEAVSFPFAAKNGGPHEVILEFAWPIADPRVEEVITAAAASTGESRAPSFDFSWRLLKEGQVVSHRESPQRSTGSVEEGTSGLGGGPRKSLGLVFGGFELKAGDQYTLQVQPGPDLAAIVRVVPRVVVERKPPMPGGY
jgi:hypothetical protein